jgi:hypothetical protein
MRLVTAALTFCLGLASCGRDDRFVPQGVEAPVFIPAFVGQNIYLEGVVSNTPAPQLWDVDLCGMEKLAGQRVRVTGTLHCTVVAQTGPDTRRLVDSAHDDSLPLVIRNPGIYYRLQGLRYEVLK